MILTVFGRSICMIKNDGPFFLTDMAHLLAFWRLLKLRFTEGFRTLDHAKWCNFAKVVRGEFGINSDTYQGTSP